MIPAHSMFAPIYIKCSARTCISDKNMPLWLADYPDLLRSIREPGQLSLPPLQGRKMCSNSSNRMNYGGGDHYTADWDCGWLAAWWQGPESVCADMGCGLVLTPVPVCDTQLQVCGVRRYASSTPLSLQMFTQIQPTITYRSKNVMASFAGPRYAILPSAISSSLYSAHQNRFIA